MISDTLFVEKSVSHQLPAGSGIKLSVSSNAFKRASETASGPAFHWDNASQTGKGFGYLSDEEIKDYANSRASGQTEPHKVLDTHEQLQALGAKFSYIVDMQDRRVKSIETRNGEVYPVFSFHRLTDDPHRVLWPLPGFQDLGNDQFLGGLDPDTVPWEQKSDKFAWRGAFNGRANPQFDVRHERMRLRPLLQKIKNNEIDPERAAEILSTFPRYRFVSRYCEDPRADVGFVDGWRVNLEKHPVLAEFEKPVTSRQDFQSYKYLIVLRGMDIGSNFYWVMNSGSLGLVMESPYASFASTHFHPWEHYVPFREDLEDFEEKLAWCEAHQPECQEMAQAAAEVCRKLARADLRDRIERGIISRLNEILA